MKHINLLPWRETLKKEREKRFGVITAVALAFTAGIWAGVHLFLASQIEYQQSRNNYLTEEIKEADKKIKEIEALEKEKENLVARMEAVQKLEEDRSKVVYLLDALIKAVPPGVSFTSLKQKDDKVTIQGFAQSDARVASLMRGISDSEWLFNPEIFVIESKSKQSKRDISTFELSFKQLTPRKKKEEEAKKEEAKEEAKKETK